MGGGHKWVGPRGQIIAQNHLGLLMHLSTLLTIQQLESGQWESTGFCCDPGFMFTMNPCLCGQFGDKL